MNKFVIRQLERVNTLLDRWMERRAKEIHFPGNVELLEDIPYLEDGRPCHRMDLYRPRDTAGPLPVIVNLHGGGMLLCTKVVNRPFCAELAKRGFLVFCLEYPLVPESDIPGILRDVARGMDTVDGMLEQFGGDRNRVYLVGDSAGAFISVYEAAARNNPLLAAAIPLTSSQLPVNALGLISGMYYTTLTDSVGFFLRKDFYGEDWKTNPMQPYFDPACEGVAGCLPPCFLVTSKSDNLHGYTAKFYKGLQKAGTPCTLVDFPLLKKLQHDFVIVKPEHPDAQRAIDRMVDFLLQHENSRN